MMTKDLVIQIPNASGSNESYLSFVYSVPILSRERELQLAIDLKENDNLEAAKQLVMAHLRFVVKVARGYRGYGLTESDLIQEGNLGLMKAVKKFDPKVGVRLVTFAVHWIKAEIHEYIIKNWRIVKIATTKAQRKLFFNLRSSKQSLDWMTKEEITELASRLRVEESDVRTMEIRLSANDCPVETVTTRDDNIGTSLELVSKNKDPEEIYQSVQNNRAETEYLSKALSILDDRTRDIIVSRWLKSPKDTLIELADKYDISAERIRQLEKDALGKMKSVIGETTSS